jgi:hypothetical protein
MPMGCSGTKRVVLLLTYLRESGKHGGERQVPLISPGAASDAASNWQSESVAWEAISLPICWINLREDGEADSGTPDCWSGVSRIGMRCG